MQTIDQKTYSSRRKVMGLIIAAGILLHAVQPGAQTYTISPDPFLRATDASNNPIVSGCVWTYAAGTTTPITTYATYAGTANSNPIVADFEGRFTAYLVPGTYYKFVYETACTSPAHGTVLRSADNVAGTPAAAATVDVTGTAGETLSAGQCAYLSAGSGGKNTGQWYKCDATNTYSSTTPTVGMALTAITAATTGSIRLAGSVTGLSSLSTGSDYYVSGTAGSITATAPTNARRVGQADSSTTFVLTGNPPPAAAATVPVFDDFRIGAASATCAPVADITGASATFIWLTPCYGNRFTVSDAAGVLSVLTSAEISIAVPATTAQMYDVWAYSNSGTLTLELLAWTNDTTRATGIARTTTGFYTKSGDLTRRYVGSFRTAGVSGQTEDSFAKRYVWNFYNRIPRILKVFESTATWTYNTAAYRQARATATNQVEAVIGVADVEVEIVLVAVSRNDTAADNTFISISDAATTLSTTPDANVLGQVLFSNLVNYAPGQAILRKYPVVGHHIFGWLEQGSGANNTVWYGNNGAATKYQTGMSGRFLG